MSRTIELQDSAGIWVPMRSKNWEVEDRNDSYAEWENERLDMEVIDRIIWKPKRARKFLVKSCNALRC